MFIGHYAVGLGAKKAAPAVGLGMLFFAAQFLDLLWPIFLILGIEHARVVPGDTAFTHFEFYDYPVSHSLVTSLVWSALIGGTYFLLRRNGKNALIVGLAVFSHWILDFVSHKPDLPLAPGMTNYFGLGLWNSTPATIIVEGLLFSAGVYFYLRATRPIDRTGVFAFWGLVIFLVVSYIANIIAPPPSDMKAVAYAGLSLWLFVFWGSWIDRHRTSLTMGVTLE